MGTAVADPCTHLRLYNRKAEELLGSSFVAHLRERRPSFVLGGAPFEAVRVDAPSDDSMRAFVLTFRMFYHNQDGLSFGKMEPFYGGLPVEEALKVSVRAIRSRLNEYLDGLTPIVAYDDQISRRRLLDSWLFGELAHVSAQEQAQLASWRVEADVTGIFQHEFETILMSFLTAIEGMCELNRRALSAICGPAAGRAI